MNLGQELEGTDLIETPGVDHVELAGVDTEPEIQDIQPEIDELDIQRQEANQKERNQLADYQTFSLQTRTIWPPTNGYPTTWFLIVVGCRRPHHCDFRTGVLWGCWYRNCKSNHGVGYNGYRLKGHVMAADVSNAFLYGKNKEKKREKQVQNLEISKDST
jgi:hypothetical protein